MNHVLVREQRIGMRPSNQDYAGHDATREALLLAVADGMGGHFGGEIAAEIAVGSLLKSFEAGATPRLADPGGFLDRALLGAHEAIRAYARARALPEAPRTVIVACVVQDGRAWWNHVGDARFYLVRDGRVEARTRDHSAAQALIDAGRLAEEAAASHPDSHRVLQSLGAPVTPQPGPGASARLRGDDVLVLCSDGFWGPIRPDRLAAGLCGRPIRQAVSELCDVAERRAGAHADNLTVLALQWIGQAGEADAAVPRTRRGRAADAPPAARGGSRGSR